MSASGITLDDVLDQAHNQVSIDVIMSGNAMDKELLILGLLIEQPMYGQQVRETIEAHHELFAEALKKPAMYYQLERLVTGGYLTMQPEMVDAPGPGRGHTRIAPREREVYRITEAGRQRFLELLRASLGSYVPAVSAVDFGLFYLHHLGKNEAIALLGERRHCIISMRTRLEQRLAEKSEAEQAAHHIVNDHTLSLIDAEVAWAERTIALLRRDIPPPPSC